MSTDLFIKWAEDSLEDVTWLSAALFNKKKAANTEILALCLALAIKYSCPRKESYRPSTTGPRTATRDEKLRVIMAATLLAEFGTENIANIDDALIERTLQDYANGGLKKLASLLEDSDDRIGALVGILEGLMTEN